MDSHDKNQTIVKEMIVERRLGELIRDRKLFENYTGMTSVCIKVLER
jgi:hypothetical protein